MVENIIMCVTIVIIDLKNKHPLQKIIFVFRDKTLCLLSLFMPQWTNVHCRIFFKVHFSGILSI